MNLLFITNHFLDANGGGSFASRAYANAFAELSDECVLLYPFRGESITEYIHPKYVLKGIGRHASSLRKLVDIYAGRIHRFSAAAIDEADRFSPDLVVFDNSRCSAGLIDEFNRRGIKTVTIHHNYEMEYYRGSPPNLLWRSALMFHMRNTERMAVRNSNLNLTLTDADIELLKWHYDQSGACSFARLGCFEYAEQKLGPQKKPAKNAAGLTFVITGNLGAHQTEVSLLPFLDELYPRLLTQCPEANLIIAGRNPSMAVTDYCGRFPSITLIPNPIDMTEVINQADVYICPTSVGGGLKLRVMDGLKAGIPVLTHEVSARGYEAFIEAGFLYAYSTIGSFSEQLNVLLTKLGNNELSAKYCLALYENNFSFRSGVDRLKLILS
jgi:glycosyltransferase involved in cell wall biosynthesis